jgi:hypothetical protein
LRIFASITAVLLPICRGRASQIISSPGTPAAKTFSFNSIVVKSWLGGRFRKVAHAATESPKAVQTPPWTKPPGWRWRPSTIRRPVATSSVISTGSIAMSPGKVPGSHRLTFSAVISGFIAAAAYLQRPGGRAPRDP